MTTPNIENLASVTAILQTALTPVFLLVAIGALLNIFVNRLARIVDRSRQLQLLYPESSGAEHRMLVDELRILGRRMQIVSTAILLAVFATIAVCAMVGMLFLMGLSSYQIAELILGTFILALVLMVASLALFVREVQLAKRNIRVRDVFLNYNAND